MCYPIDTHGSRRRAAALMNILGPVSSEPGQPIFPFKLISFVQIPNKISNQFAQASSQDMEWKIKIKDSCLAATLDFCSTKQYNVPFICQ